MSKKHKATNNSQQNQLGGFKKFVLDVSATLKKFNIEGSFAQMSQHYKRMMWDYKLVIRHPVAGNDHISSKELKHIASETRKYFHTPTQKLVGKKVSAYELLLINCYCQIRSIELGKQPGTKEDPKIWEMNEIKGRAFNAFCTKYFLDYFRVIIGLNNPDKKHYGVSLYIPPIIKEYPSFELVTKVHGFDPIKRMMVINGQKRPAYRLSKADAVNLIIYITMDAGLLKDFYKGNKKELEVYIQSHALNRMRERLDLLSHAANNYLLWENTHTISNFVFYKNYLYLPVKLYDVTVGYLLASIVDDQLLFRTFLFVTHSSTPEGDKLKQVTGLGKQDISYWHIDRLSTFVKFNDEKYPGLSALFDKAGLGGLNLLKDKEFDIEALQDANLDGLTEYIGQGKGVKLG